MSNKPNETPLSPTSLVNPNYSTSQAQPPPPYPGIHQPTDTSPPPAYGFQIPTAAVAASSSLNQAIALNGRNPITVVCPNCYQTVTTNITQLISPVFQKTPRLQYAGFVGFTILFICALLTTAILTGTNVPFYVLPGVILITLLGFTSFRKQRRTTQVIYSDIYHSCPSCRTKLGVSNGLQLYQLHVAGRRNRNI